MPALTQEQAFVSRGVRCAAWHIRAQNDELVSSGGRPCVVMAHGFGGTRDTGLLPYAESFAAAGMDVLVFDYRGFGASKGTPRQLISYRRQREDYHAAILAARQLPGVDPERIALWGTSYSAGHVIAVAAQSSGVAGVVSMTPAADGLATVRVILRQPGGLGHLLRLSAHGVWDVVQVLLDREPHCIPIVGQPGTTSMINVSGAEEAYTSIAGPTWRNATGARHALEVARNRATLYAGRVRCPMLVQIGTLDRVVPVEAARRMAGKAGDRATLIEYPVDHFDVYACPRQQALAADQVEFLRRTLAPDLTASRGGHHKI